MNFEITKENQKAINSYKNEKNSNINLLLNSDIENELLITEQDYNEKDIIENIDIIKNIYESMIKNFHNNPIKTNLNSIFDENSNDENIMPIIDVLGINKISDTIDLSEKLDENETKELLDNIIQNIDEINSKIAKCIKLDEQNSVNYENIRKLEQLLVKHHFTMEQPTYDLDTSDEEKQNDIDDINRINAELDNLKGISVQVFNERLEHIKYIADWKNDISIYLKNVFNLICDKYKKLEEKKNEELEKNKKENKSTKIKLTGNSVVDTVKNECQENIAVVETLIKNIKNLITRQQNHARIAESINSNYKALNNAFEMKNFAEELDSLVKAISNKVDALSANDAEQLDKISKTSLQVNVLLNYLNNARSATTKKLSRFDEINIIEENELKREIAETIKNIRCEAELKKLRDDIDLIEYKSAFSKFIGRFTGKNKLDRVMLDQIEIRQTAIRKNFKVRLPLARNYSIHELIAEIEMFIKENKDDELVVDDVNTLRKIKNELKKNFVIIDSKVVSIIDQKTGKNLPLASEKLSKKELIEIDTYRFLNRYGYDKINDVKEPDYQDTLANEINRIIEYIKSSEIL